MVFYGVMAIVGYVSLVAAAAAHEWLSVAVIAAATAWFIYRVERLVEALSRVIPLPAARARVTRP